MMIERTSVPPDHVLALKDIERWVAKSDGGEVLASAAFATWHERRWACLTVERGLEPSQAVRVVLAMRRRLMESTEDIYSLVDPIAFPNAERLDETLGFVRTDDVIRDGEKEWKVWVWPSSKR